MNKINGEILNRLIDNELTSSEIDELHKLIKEDDEQLSKTKAHQLVDNVLKKMEIDIAPAGVTELIMDKIATSVLKKERKNGFFKFVMGGFIATTVLVIGFVLNSRNESNSDSSSLHFLDSITDKVLNYFSELSLPINSNLLLIISSVLTIIVLTSGYVIFEQHKSFKQKLNRVL